jgi:hypothetical protein
MGIRLLAFLFCIGIPAVALAHGGGLNADGCHNNRKTGDYHCHGTRATSPPRTAMAPVAPSRAAASRTVHYRNCDAARAAGAAPVRTGDPGYARHLDRDGDGVGCE